MLHINLMTQSLSKLNLGAMYKRRVLVGEEDNREYILQICCCSWNKHYSPPGGSHVNFIIGHGLEFQMLYSLQQTGVMSQHGSLPQQCLGDVGLMEAATFKLIMHLYKTLLLSPHCWRIPR